jgi:hypothetical protein
MTARVVIPGSTNPGKMLLQFVARQQEALAMGRRVKAILDKAQWGTPTDWLAVAEELGITGIDAATKAQEAWGIIGAAMAQIDHAAVLELARLDQG